MDGVNSDDDFESTSPRLKQAPVQKNLQIPVGHILAAPKWQTSPVVTELKSIIIESIFLFFSSCKITKFYILKINIITVDCNIYY